MPAASVAVITRDIDITADLVVAELARRGVGIVRFDLGDFPERLTQIAYLVGGRTRWTGVLRGPRRDLDLQAIRSVWYRKPAPIAVHSGMTATEQRWATAEAEEGLGGLLAALPAVWVNNPERIAVADRKPHQLQVAAVSGLHVPETLLTNDPEQARAFCHAHRGDGVVYKSLGAGPPSEDGRRTALWATTITADDITDGVRRTTHLFQARVPSAYAVRVTAVGRQMFAARIDLAAGDTAVDWRAAATPPTYTRIDVPDNVATGIRRVMDTFGLLFACPDLLVTADGQWMWIGDLNPNGQWAWIPCLREPITNAIADLLEGTP